MRLLLLGPPGAGKGTQGQRLAQSLGLPHIATGDIIRDHIARGTNFGRKVQAAIAAGNFAPDEDILYWVSKRLAEQDAQGGYILDGFPRDLAQGKAFDAQSPTCQALDRVLELFINTEALTERLAGRLVCPLCDRVYHVRLCPPQTPGVCDVDRSALVRRPDDAPEAVRHRISVYETMTLPLRDYYGRQGVLRSVDAEGEPDDVFRRLMEALDVPLGARKMAHVEV